MTEEVVPEFELMTGAFVEVGRHAVAVREERARAAGALEAEALGAAGQPGFEVAADGVGEEEPDIGVLGAEAAEEGEVAEALRRERDRAVGDAPRFDEGEEGLFSDENELGVGARGAESAEGGRLDFLRVNRAPVAMFTVNIVRLSRRSICSFIRTSFASAKVNGVPSGRSAW